MNIIGFQPEKVNIFFNFLFLVLYIYGSLLYNTFGVIILATDRMRYTVSVDRDMFQEIEDFRFSRRFQTRAEATVELIRLGLEQLKKEENQNPSSEGGAK